MAQRVTLPDPRIQVAGALAVDELSVGLTFRRLPDHVRHELPVEVQLIVASPSGVRLRFRTDASMIGLECLPTVIQLDDGEPYPATVDLVVGGQVLDSASTTGGNRAVVGRVQVGRFELHAGDPVTLALTDPDVAGERTVELWLPNGSLGDFHAVVVGDGASLAPPDPDTRPRWIHHGSSISHCMEARGPARTWPALVANAVGADLLNLGFAGQCHLDQFTARTIRDLPADRLSLKVGINVVNGASMRERAFASALHGFLDTVRDGHPDTPFLVVSPIICPAHEEVPGPSVPTAEGPIRAGGRVDDIPDGALTLRRVREVVAHVVEARRDAGDDNLHHRSGLELFDQADVVDLPDGLHPNAIGYERIAERFAALAFAPGAPLAL